MPRFGSELSTFSLRSLSYYGVSLHWEAIPLRVISLVPHFPNTPIDLTTVDTFTEYQYGTIDGGIWLRRS
ncbi:hypothetical protein N7533_012962 [Penicillium manginii]|uniref:uncharacterized protein n=1 Tax=Penicillium manginii TaxID=203109 RepID=UPI0025470DD1|nr:uncharacterized protein N7533_012962 [Penicillium manginii]KAJ5734559.1 hypothetical protein N7533_012962 [Penicillium manginii]